LITDTFRRYSPKSVRDHELTLKSENVPAPRSFVKVYAMTDAAPGKFPVTTAFELPGMVVDTDLGLAFGLVVRSMGIAKSFGASFTALRQGEVTQYTQLLEDSRRHAIDRMVENAKLLGGNAVIAMRFDSSEIGQQLTEIVAYGTAVVVRPSGT
jgi:uncharacterized protein YbjQ (UPF0145 family)